MEIKPHNNWLPVLFLLFEDVAGAVAVVLLMSVGERCLRGDQVT